MGPVASLSLTSQQWRVYRRVVWQWSIGFKECVYREPFEIRSMKVCRRRISVKGQWDVDLSQCSVEDQLPYTHFPLGGEDLDRVFLEGT